MHFIILEKFQIHENKEFAVKLTLTKHIKYKDSLFCLSNTYFFEILSDSVFNT